MTISEERRDRMEDIRNEYMRITRRMNNEIARRISQGLTDLQALNGLAQEILDGNFNAICSPPPPGSSVARRPSVMALRRAVNDLNAARIRARIAATAPVSRDLALDSRTSVLNLGNAVRNLTPELTAQRLPNQRISIAENRTSLRTLSFNHIQNLRHLADSRSRNTNRQERTPTPPRINANEFEIIPAYRRNANEFEIIAARRRNANEVEIIPARRRNANEFEIIPARRRNANEVEIIPAPRRNANEVEIIPAPRRNANEVEIIPALGEIVKDPERTPPPRRIANDLERTPPLSGILIDPERTPPPRLPHRITDNNPERIPPHRITDNNPERMPPPRPPPRRNANDPERTQPPRSGADNPERMPPNLLLLPDLYIPPYQFNTNTFDPSDLTLQQAAIIMSSFNTNNDREYELIKTSFLRFSIKIYGFENCLKKDLSLAVYFFIERHFNIRPEIAICERPVSDHQEKDVVGVLFVRCATATEILARRHVLNNTRCRVSENDMCDWIIWNYLKDDDSERTPSPERAANDLERTPSPGTAANDSERTPPF